MTRSPPRTDRDGAPVASYGTLNRTAGALASSTWIKLRGYNPPTFERWNVQIALGVDVAPPSLELDERSATRFQLDIYSDEWGLLLCHANRTSSIRITDIAFVHGRDDFNLLTVTPPLRDIGMLLRRVEREHALTFQRKHARISTNLSNLEPSIRAWVASL